MQTIYKSYNTIQYSFTNNHTMGCYYGLTNITQNTHVSEGNSCWKGFPYCEIHLVMHQFGWKSTDSIISGSYDDIYRFVFSSDKNTMSLQDLEYMGIPERKEGTDTIFRSSFDKDIFGGYLVSNHVPKWDTDMKCTCCGFQFDKKNLNDKFSGTFFQN